MTETIDPGLKRAYAPAAGDRARSAPDATRGENEDGKGLEMPALFH